MKKITNVASRLRVAVVLGCIGLVSMLLVGPASAQTPQGAAIADAAKPYIQDAGAQVLNLWPFALAVAGVFLVIGIVLKIMKRAKG